MKTKTIKYKSAISIHKNEQVNIIKSDINQIKNSNKLICKVKPYDFKPLQSISCDKFMYI